MSCGQVPSTTSGNTVMVTGPSQLSVAVTNEMSDGGMPAEAQTVRLDGHCVMTGGVVSLTRMCWLNLAVFPQLSVAIQVRVMRLLQLEPGLLWVSVGTGVIAPSQLSVAVTEAGSGTSPIHCTVELLGTPISA